MPTVLAHCYRDFTTRIRQRFLKRHDLPWMKSKELDIIVEVLDNLRPRTCFEWGSGYSTAYFPQRITGMENWYSVEHNKGWYKTISKTIHDKRVRLECIEPHPCNEFVQRPHDRERFRDYIAAAGRAGTKLDFIFIDGRARRECLKKACEVIKDDGIVILHDANRKRYHAALPPFASSVLFTDYRKMRGGLWIGSKTRDLNSVLRIGLHTKIWRTHNMVARLLLMR